MYFAVKFPMKLLLLISPSDKVYCLSCLIILSYRYVELRGLWDEIDTDSRYGSEDGAEDVDRDPILRNEHIV